MASAFGEDLYVGRPADREELMRLIRAAQAGSGCLLLVSGDPGMGKTRFAEEATRVAAARGFAVAWGQCTEEAGPPPYLPWMHVLRELAVSSLQPSGGHWQAHSEGNSRFQLFEEVVEALRDAASRAPVLMVLDDLQWADAATLHLLQYAASRLPSLPVMVLASHREAEAGGELEGILPNLGRQRGVRRLPLRPLSPARRRARGRLVRRCKHRPAPGRPSKRSQSFVKRHFVIDAAASFNNRTRKRPPTQRSPHRAARTESKGYIARCAI